MLENKKRERIFIWSNDYRITVGRKQIESASQIKPRVSDHIEQIISEAQQEFMFLNCTRKKKFGKYRIINEYEHMEGMRCQMNVPEKVQISYRNWQPS